MVALLAAAALTLMPAAAERPADLVRVAGAIDRSMVVSTGNATAYLTIANDGRGDERLLSVTCTWCGAVEIHAMTVSHGKPSMQRLSYGVKIPSGKTLSLNPGTAHVMLVRPRVMLTAGGHAKVTLHFLHAGAVDALLPVTDVCKAPAPLPARRRP